MKLGRASSGTRATEERLRIALVIGTLGVGGAETQLCRLASELKSKGHVVKLFAIMDGGPLADELVANGVDFEVFYFRGFVYRDEVRGLVPGELLRSFKCVWQFWRSMWRFSPDVCEAYLLWAYILAIPGAAIARVPVRISARRGLSSTVRLQRRVRVLRTIANSVTTVVLANSTLVAQDIRDVEHCLPKRIEVIPNAIDIPSEIADVRSVPVKGLVVANLIKYKGHEDLLRALSLMRSPPQVTCIGGGPERKRLESLATELGLNDFVCFVGRLPNAGQEFAKYQFAILASHEEGMPNAVLEAMSFGVPVVATSVGGVPELIEDSVTGLLVPPHDPAALAAAIESIVQDGILRSGLGTRARTKAREFSWEISVASRESLYRSHIVRGRLSRMIRYLSPRSGDSSHTDLAQS